MKSLLKKFLSRDRGAVTVDWVVLTAALITLTIASYSTIEDGVDGTTGNVQKVVDDWEF